MSAPRPTPEEVARKNIDALLQQCGWLVQDYKRLDLSAGKGIAVREVRLNKGRCDYLLLIDRKPVGIVGANNSRRGQISEFAAENDTRRRGRAKRGPSPGYARKF
ncbi:MAG: hypothetical protein ACR2ID_04405 [Chthoniobacterales bacterium]